MLLYYISKSCKYLLTILLVFTNSQYCYACNFCYLHSFHINFSPSACTFRYFPIRLHIPMFPHPPAHSDVSPSACTFRCFPIRLHIPMFPHPPAHSDVSPSACTFRCFPIRLHIPMFVTNVHPRKKMHYK